MSQEILIRAATAEDETEWREMWDGYCTFYEVTVPEEVTATTWQRILDPVSTVKSLIACDEEGKALGFANYVLHPHTWSAKTLCYLEDLYVRPEARGKNVGYNLIERLIAMGHERDWNRVYWHTNADNSTARRLYDRFQPAGPYVRYTVSLPVERDEPTG